jgi:hypothetical protein
MPLIAASRQTAGQARYVPRPARYAATHGQRRVSQGPPPGSLRGYRGVRGFGRLGDDGTDDDTGFDTSNASDIVSEITTAVQPLINAAANNVSGGGGYVYTSPSYSASPASGGGGASSSGMNPGILLLGALVIGGIFLMSSKGGGLPPITESTTTTRRSRS